MAKKAKSQAKVKESEEQTTNLLATVKELVEGLAAMSEPGSKLKELKTHKVKILAEAEFEKVVAVS